MLWPAPGAYEKCVFEIGKEMSIEGCYCGLSVICELNDHAMSGTALPERMKEGYLSVILELRNSCTTKRGMRLFSDNLLCQKKSRLA